MSVNCDPDALLAASAEYRKITGSNVGAVIIYLLAKKAGLDSLTSDQLMDLAKCHECKIPPGMMKAVEVALLCSATGGVTPCPPCPPSGGGGGCSYQDMQVAWTPTNLKLGEMLQFRAQNGTNLPGITSLTFNQQHSMGGFNIGNATDLVTVSFPNLIDIDPNDLNGGLLAIENCNSLTSVSLPLFVTVTPDNGVSMDGNPSLTTVDMPLYVPGNGTGDSWFGCALSAATVNALLARYVANAGFVSGNILLSGGTNAAPSGQGIADKATLIGRGVTVNTN